LTRVIMPSPEGELACLIDADLKVNNSIVRVLMAHFGNTEDELDLKLQHELFINMLKSRDMPTIIVSYMTMEPWSARYKDIISTGMLDTSKSFDRYCLYVMYKHLHFTAFRRVDQGDLSDTEAQIGFFELDTSKINNLDCVLYASTPGLCIESSDCGWCRIARSGTCVNKTLSNTCKKVGGNWLGKESDSSVVDRDSVLELSKHSQNQNLFSFTESFYTYDNTIVYSFPSLWNFEDVFKNQTYESPLFVIGGYHWQLNIIYSPPPPETGDVFFEILAPRINNQEWTRNFNISIIFSNDNNTFYNVASISKKDNKHRIFKLDRYVFNGFQVAGSLKFSMSFNNLTGTF